MTLVLDASVAIKLGVSEPGDVQARLLIVGGETIIAPDILPAEVANALWKKEMRGDLNEAERDAALRACLDAYDELVSSKDLAPRALELAVALRHPAYDCFYLALSEARSATFITADGRLLAKLAAGWAGAFAPLL